MLLVSKWNKRVLFLLEVHIVQLKYIIHEEWKSCEIGLSTKFLRDIKINDKYYYYITYYVLRYRTKNACIHLILSSTCSSIEFAFYNSIFKEGPHTYTLLWITIKMCFVCIFCPLCMYFVVAATIDTPEY